MIVEPQAREAAKGAFESDGVVVGVARELSEGWLFPCVTERPVGSRSKRSSIAARNRFAAS